MSIDVNFSGPSNFDAGKPSTERALAELVDQLTRAFAAVVRGATPKLTPTNLKLSAYAAELDELVSASGTFVVTLPVATAKNAGRSIGVVVHSGTVTVTTADGSVQGAASDALATVGLRVYTSDGIGWWRAP